MAIQTAKSKLPDVQAPQPRRTIPNSQPLESQTDHQPRTRSWSWPAGSRAEQACSMASEPAQRSRHARRVDPKVWADVDFYLGIQWSPSRLQARWRSATRAFTCMCMRTKPPAVIYTPTCAVKSPGANATCAGVTGADRFPIVDQSARDPATLKIASRCDTGMVIPSLARLTNKPL